MKTGEGKTFVAAAAAILHLIEDSAPVFISTANEYLAERDFNWLFPLYDVLGINAGLIKEVQNLEDKQFNYLNKEIVYGSLRAFVFDYLRDNLVYDLKHICQKERNFLIIDEIDSMLIDETRTPLIISELIISDFLIMMN